MGWRTQQSKSSHQSSNILSKTARARASLRLKSPPDRVLTRQEANLNLCFEKQSLKTTDDRKKLFQIRGTPISLPLGLRRRQRNRHHQNLQIYILGSPKSGLLALKSNQGMLEKPRATHEYKKLPFFREVLQHEIF